MFITQISVFLENVKGTLCKVTTILADNNIDIVALTIADTSGFGIVRFIVREEDIERSLSLLKNAGYSARKNHVLCVKGPNEPGSLNRILTILEKAGISIEYLYSVYYSAEGQCLLLFRLSDRDAGKQVLEQNGIAIVSQEELNKLGR